MGLSAGRSSTTCTRPADDCVTGSHRVRPRRSDDRRARPHRARPDRRAAPAPPGRRRADDPHRVGNPRRADRAVTALPRRAPAPSGAVAAVSSAAAVVLLVVGVVSFGGSDPQQLDTAGDDRSSTSTTASTSTTSTSTTSTSVRVRPPRPCRPRHPRRRCPARATSRAMTVGPRGRSRHRRPSHRRRPQHRPPPRSVALARLQRPVAPRPSGGARRA